MILNNLNNKEMDFKGTKGKWNHIKSYDHHIEVDGKILVTIHCHEGGKPKYDGRLISKSPEMLEMLKRVLHEYQTNMDLTGDDIQYEIENLIKEATTL